MAIYALGDAVPVVDPTAYVHPDAVVIGSVILGPYSSVWPGAVLRADDNVIEIGARSNVQDGAILHCTRELRTVVGDNVTLGHLCHLEGCTIENRALVGVGSVVLHEAVVGEGALVGAGAVVTNRMVVPPRAMALGIPAKIREGAVAEGANDWFADTYVARAQRFQSQLRRVD